MSMIELNGVKMINIDASVNATLTIEEFAVKAGYEVNYGI